MRIKHRIMLIHIEDKGIERTYALEEALCQGYTHVCSQCGKYYHEENEFFSEVYCSQECEDAAIEAEYQACLELGFEDENC